jgi:hypothetical protein
MFAELDETEAELAKLRSWLPKIDDRDLLKPTESSPFLSTQSYGLTLTLREQSSVLLKHILTSSGNSIDLTI